MTDQHDYDRSRATANGMIRRWGAPALLRRAGTDRPCLAGVTAFTPQERLGRVTNPTDRKAIVSALAPDGSVLEPPDMRLDQLVTLDRDTGAELDALRIVEPPGKVPDTGSAVPVFWRLTVRG